MIIYLIKAIQNVIYVILSTDFCLQHEHSFTRYARCRGMAALLHHDCRSKYFKVFPGKKKNVLNKFTIIGNIGAIIQSICSLF